MQVYHDWQALPPEARGSSCAMGNFDGVHLGHQAVIDLARRPQAALGLITFEPHPRQFFARDGAPFRLMNASARANRLAKLGVQQLFELPFNRQLAELEPEEFVRDILAKGLGISHLVVGADFCFGRKRAGTAQDLADLGQIYGFETTIAELVTTQSRPISSTAIRSALAQGQPRAAAAMLGHWHRIVGPVIHGEKRGRELGFPTANMGLNGLHLPKLGVYAVKVDILNGPHKGSYNGAASLGVRPMFGENTPNLETYIFDFKGDLYDTEVSVALVDYLRPELKFDSLAGLIEQMDRDCARAREILAAL